GIARSYFINSELKDNKFNSYHAEDLIKGEVENIPIEFCELHVENKLTVWMDPETSVVFRGIFFHGRLGKKFIGRTLILPDEAEKKLGKYFGGMAQELWGEINEKGNLLQLENPQFEKLFAVYADDQVEARSILTPKVMENLTTFQNQYGRAISLSFKENHVYAIFPFWGEQQRYLEPTFFSPLTSDVVEEFYEILQMMVRLVQELNLGYGTYQEMHKYGGS
ncbi:MAG: DUF3137 domain-containing protein, partial [Pseudomonadota bacterium]